MNNLRRYKYMIIAGVLLVICLVGFKQIFFTEDVTRSRFSNPREIFKLSLYGVVKNNTSHELKVTDYKFIETLPPGKSSDESHYADVDSILIERPMQIDGTLYNSGVFKFCDFASFEVREENGVDIAEDNGSGLVCKMTFDFGHFNSIQEAFH